MLLKFIDDFLNQITMYRLVLYYVIALVLVGMVLGFFGLVPYSPLFILASTMFILGICYLTNILFAWGFDAPVNVESVYITAFILTLIISPMTSLSDAHFLPIAFWASVLAIASKFIVAIGKKHLFNPAAFGVMVTALTLGLSATWWVGTAYMLPGVLVGGLLMTRKLRRFDLVLSFILVAAISSALPGLLHGTAFLTAFSRIVLSTPLFFFAFVMLTEPLTSPPTKLERIGYGMGVGFLFSPGVHVFSLYSTPELTLFVGNIFTYLVSPKQKLLLKLKEKIKVSHNVYDFVFEKLRPFHFHPGQYMEWTFAHPASDSRGIRRYFTIASAPAERDIRIGLKFYESSSSFKKNLLAMKEGEVIVASQLAGEFIMPHDVSQKLVFIAGGIGVTPFRSMIADLITRREKRDVVMLYANRKAEDVAYKEVFDQAERELGIKTVYALSDEPNPVRGMYPGSLTSDLVMTAVPDYHERTFYISGPHAMVDAFQTTLRGMSIPPSRIKVDFFPGFA